MKYTTIITDLDRTLLKTDKSISNYTISILKQCKEKGMNIIVASARPLRNIDEYNKLIGFDALVVSNGARIIKNNNIIEYKIPFNSGSKILELLNDNELQITVETGDEAYSNVKLEYFQTTVTQDLLDVLKNKGSLKMVVAIKDENTNNLVKTKLDEEVYSTIANNSVIQIMSKKATKWSGVEKILKLSNIDSSKCIYFGDDFDDIEPIEKCGIGVAMQNALDECKKVSNYICKSNDEDGVAHFIEEFILKEEK